MAHGDGTIDTASPATPADGSAGGAAGDRPGDATATAIGALNRRAGRVQAEGDRTGAAERLVVAHAGAAQGLSERWRPALAEPGDGERLLAQVARPSAGHATSRAAALESQYRQAVVEGMQLINSNGCCRYPEGGEGYGLRSQYWLPAVGYSISPALLPPASTRVSDAIEDLFRPKAGSRLECQTAMLAVQFRAMLRVMKKGPFDARFDRKALIDFTPFTRKGLIEHGIFKRVSIRDWSDLQPGDWVYFRNFEDYATRHPRGLWAGLHAVYVGIEKGQQIFQGFGLARPLTRQQIYGHLIRAYNGVSARGRHPSPEERAMHQIGASFRTTDASAKSEKTYYHATMSRHFGLEPFAIRPDIQKLSPSATSGPGRSGGAGSSRPAGKRVRGARP
jgi:hypothetical protein